jgi:hypothetical protein
MWMLRRVREDTGRDTGGDYGTIIPRRIRYHFHGFCYTSGPIGLEQDSIVHR